VGNAIVGDASEGLVRGKAWRFRAPWIGQFGWVGSLHHWGSVRLGKFWVLALEAACVQLDWLGLGEWTQAIKSLTATR